MKLVCRCLLLWMLCVKVVVAESKNDRSGSVLLKTDILAVFAHPDDETGMAATLAYYALVRGKVVSTIYCTRGEGGGNMVGTHWGPALGVLREVELRACLDRLGVRQAFFLDREDFGYTENLDVTFERWGKDETLRRLVRLVRTLRPEVILTMNPAPSSGQHGNHQAAAILAIEAVDAAANPARYPEQLQQEGLGIWRPRKLYITDRSHGGTTIDLTTPLPGGETPVRIAALALANHRSQGFGGMVESPWFRRMTNQTFTLVKSVVPFDSTETDLLRGLPVMGETPERVYLETHGHSALTLRFAPSEAVVNYWRWCRAERVENILADFEPEFAMAVGEEGLAFLDLGNRASKGAGVRLRFKVPDGWQVKPDDLLARFSPRPGTTLPVAVTPPATAKSGDSIVVTGTTEQGELSATGTLRILPTARATRVTTPLSVTEKEGWSALPVVEISPAQLWQGHVASAADSSATVRVGHDDQYIYTEVTVRDDQVVSNIEPNDIRGHWRSDSVELCFDPHQASDHTFICYKLGIFPFDTTGKVRAARDADAQPGLVEKTAPGTQLASERTPDGYRIRAAVPIAEVGLDYPRSKRLGFNVLIYDGDKAGAALGENINKSRLAWSPRPGVQGRPSDWGRLILE
jgi:LmbE family N-acetylglucosaminyl deacetylase